MKRRISVFVALAMIGAASLVFAAYHHEGEQDSDKFLATYPSKAGTKLDHCALCHSGGSYVNKKGQTVNLGSCQWCHDTYGYDGSGNIINTLNPYGMDYLVNGRNAAAVKAIENLDSDGDGFANLMEIEAKRFPGDPDDDPSKVVAPYRIYTRAELEAMPRHTQFMLMNTSRSGDFYAQYTGVPMEDLLEDAGMTASATGIKVYAPDGWSNYHPLEMDPTPEFYHVQGAYPESVYYYDTQADEGLNPVDGWCDYSAPSCQGRNHLDPIFVQGGLKMLLAIKREGQYMDPGVLNEDNKLDGEGPFRVVPPQKNPTPPDQSSRADNQAVIWPYDYDWDHNAGAASRSATIIKVEPLPPGTTDIDILEAGWDYVDQAKLVIYGAIGGDDDGGNGGGFDWGDCSGSGAFQQMIVKDEAIDVGEIPSGKEGVYINLNCVNDVDIQLFDKATGEMIVGWTPGDTSMKYRKTINYMGMRIEYSGYEGMLGKKGNEYIEIKGVTTVDLLMKAFGYVAGNANVTYSWAWTPGCTPDESGEGSFQQQVTENGELLVGTLVPGLCNVYIGLISNRDVDIRLYDHETEELIIGWVSGDTSQRNAMMKDYRGCTIEYSGYNGVGGNPGHEFIKIPGCTNRSLVMKVFGYQSGNSQVNYNWGP